MEGKYTGIRYVHATGEIEAKVWYTKTMEAKYVEESEERTGNEEIKRSISINNFTINFNKKLSKFEKYDTINENKKFSLKMKAHKILQKEGNVLTFNNLSVK